jgi:uncharacterized membrane protein
MKGHHDLRLVSLLTVICALGSLVTVIGPVRIVFAAPLALVLPGYAIAAAAFGRRRLGLIELVPLTVGISLSALVLGSVVLNYTPGGIRGGTWIALLVLLVLGCCRLAAVRRGPGSSRQLPLQLPRLSGRAAILLVGALALTAAALTLAQTTLPAGSAYGFTELWLVPTDQTPVVARIGVASQQQRRTAYRLVVKVGDAAPVSRKVVLEPAEKLSLDFSAPPTPQPTPVEADLYLRGEPKVPYRSVSGWVPSSGETTP